MHTLLLQTGLRQQAIFIPETVVHSGAYQLTPTTGVLVANLAKLGFGVSEPLLHALNHTTPAWQVTILETFREVMGVNQNWMPLVKNWEVPTNESFADHVAVAFASAFNGKGTRLRCGHIIPPNTFPLERYNGCPFCGTPFETGGIENYQQNSKVRMLHLWTTEKASAYLADLLRSKTPLDASQTDSLKSLLQVLPLPAIQPAMKETLAVVADVLIAKDDLAGAGALFTTPTDILRYLWYKHTGFAQLIMPKTILRRRLKNNSGFGIIKTAKSAAAEKIAAIVALKLKYSRKEGLMVARWLNNMPLDVATMCEIMHPKRGMWVRFIRALRLAEFSRREGFAQLRTLMDTFYRQDYTVWQGRVNHFQLRYDRDNTLKLLQQRPGLFARSLFANILWFGQEAVIPAFTEVAHKVPARLLLTLQMYAAYYFDPATQRAVKPLGGVNKHIPVNKLVFMYEADQLKEMQNAVTALCIQVMQQRFAAVATNAKTIYIAPALYNIPVPIGDRSEQIQDLPAALMGTRYKVDSDNLLLFLQWGKGLPAQHLDMDLSCFIAYDHQRVDICSYSRLHTTGCKHSGDIRAIPHQVGTAEYIKLDIAELDAAGARYVTFTCNAYSGGALTPNLVVGWMNSEHKMTVSEKTGVAYDPSCVDQMLRITQGLTKGLVFGVLDVVAREIIWLELAFGGQVVQQLDLVNISSILKKLESKLSIGQLLEAKAAAQQLQMVETPTADEVYTLQWAVNTSAVTQLLIG